MGKFDPSIAPAEFIAHINASSLKELHIDDRFAQGYAFKLLGTSSISLKKYKIIAKKSKKNMDKTGNKSESKEQPFHRRTMIE